MYNVLFGKNELSEELLNILNLTEEDFGRFRDCYLSEDKRKIIVYTRCGGGNREDYEYVYEAMKKHPLYLCNYDDNFDCTYASFEFKLPKEYIKKYSKCEVDTMPGAKKWKKLFKTLEGSKK